MAENLHVNDNGFRASKLLVVGGGYLTKQLLLQRAIQGTFTTIDDFLADVVTKQQISQLVNKGLIKSSQNNIIYPSNGIPTNLDDWDITLTTLILNNCFKLSKYETYLIQEVRSLRNTLYGHTAKVEMTDAEFVQNWSSISSALTKHSSVLTDASCKKHIQYIITDVSKETLSAEKAILIQKQWYEWGIEVEQKLQNNREDQQKRFDTYEKRATDRHAEIYGEFQMLHSTCQRIETEMSSMKKLIQCDDKQTVDVIELNRHIAQANINLEAHKQDLKEMNIPYKTRMTEETTKTLKQNKIVTLKGIPGAGKTHLAKNIMIHFLSLYTNIKPLIMRTPSKIENVLDPMGSFILLIDDFVGKVAFDGFEQKDWQSYVDNFVSQIKVGELYVIITIRTAIFSQIEFDCMLFETGNVIDIDECLSVDEKRKLVEVYANNDSVEISSDKIERIVSKKSIGVGFPFLCRMMKGQTNVEKLFERPIHCMVTEIKTFKIHNPTGYCALLMTLICDNKLSKKGLSNEQTKECFKKLQSFFESTLIDLNLLYQAAHSLENTYISFKETLFYFEFIHEAVAHSIFLAALEMMPQILFNHCQLDTLISNLNLLWGIKEGGMSEDGKKRFFKTHQQMLITRIMEIMCSENAHKDVKSIANAAIWNDKSFMDEAMITFNIKLFYHCDNDGKSLITYFGRLGNLAGIKAIIESNSHIDSSVKSEQLYSALTEACLTSKIYCVEYLKLKCPEITKEVVFAAVKGGNMTIVTDMVSQFGLDLIHQQVQKDTGKTVLHIASETGNKEVVSYICFSWPSIINERDTNGAKAIHSAAAKGKTDCLRTILKYFINSTVSLTNKGETILHLASKFGHIETIRFICELSPGMIQMIDEDSNTAIHSTGSNGNITCLQYLIKIGIDPTQKNKNGVSVAFKAAQHGNFGILNYMLESYKEVLHDRDIATGITLLHKLAKMNNLECLKLLIKEGIQPDVKTNAGATMLHFAAASKSKKTVQYICQQFKGMLFSTDNKQTNAAHYAAKTGTEESLKFLIEQGINPKDKCSNGSTILHMAALGGNITVLRYIYDIYPDMIHDTDNYRRNATHYAAQNGTEECLKIIIEQGINPKDKDIFGCTILHRSAIGGNITVLRYICDTYPDMIHATDNNKRNAAHDAAGCGTVECLKFLIEQGINPRDKDVNGSTILHKAALGGNITVLRYICDTYPDMINDTDNNKKNAVHYAAQNGTVECLKFLIEQGINPRDIDTDGETFLHRAAFGSNITVLRYICDIYQDMIRDTANNKRNAAHRTAQNGTVECLKFLIEQGINPRDIDTNGSTILHMAALCGDITVVQYICNTYPDMIHDTANNKNNAAHYASQNGTVECLKFLIEQGINPSDKDTDEETIIHRAALGGNITVLRYICDTYPNMVDDQNKYKRNAAHRTAQHGTVECLKFLIEQGINLRDKDSYRLTILHMAAAGGNITVLRYICDTYPDMIHDTGNNKRNAAHLAATNSTVECLKFLIEQGIIARDNDTVGSNILHIAAVGGNITVLRYICETYPDMILDTDNNKRNAAYVGAQNGTIECLRFLIEQGINPRDKDSDRSTILHRSAIGGNITVLRYICDTYPDMIHDTDNNKRNAAHDAAGCGTVECLKFLIEQGINPRDKDVNGSTILHKAALGGNITVLRYICDTYPDMINDTDNNKKNAAHDAAGCGTVECLKFLIEQGINPRDKDVNGSTILHKAALGGNITVLRYICDTYPDMIHDTDNNKKNAVHYAAQNGTVECLKFLIEHGLHPRYKDADGSTILHIAVGCGNITMLRYICDTYPDMIHGSDNNKRNAARYAAQKGKVESMKFLIEQGINPRYKDSDGSTILHMAAAGGNITVLRYICDTYTDMIDDQNKYKRNAAHRTAQNGTVECLKFLIEQGINPRDKDSDGSTILHMAAAGGNITVLRYICDTYPDMIRNTDNNKSNSAHGAAQHSTEVCLKFLIEQGINPRETDSDGSTILHMAAISDNIKVVQYICDTYPDMIYDTDNNKRNAAHLAAESGTVECLKCLIDREINPKDRDIDGETILHKASLSGNIPVLRYICDSCPDIVHDTNKYKRNAAHRNAQNGTVECLRFLIEQGLNPRDRDTDGSNILHMAAGCGNITVLRYICDTYPNMIHDTNNNKRNAVHLAAKNGTVECLKFLIEQGINPRDKDKFGSTIIHKAVKGNNVSVLQYIYETYNDLVVVRNRHFRRAAYYATADSECLHFLQSQGVNSDKHEKCAVS